MNGHAGLPEPVSVVISYAREDRARVVALSGALRRAGLDVWWDERIAGGQAFSREIAAALAKADAVIVAWSEAAVVSDWVRDEAGWARDHGCLVAITLDGTSPPLGFGQYHSIDFSRWKGRAAAAPIAKLSEAVALVVAGRGRSAATSPAPLEQTVRYCAAADGVRIAYACTGEGAPVVKAANWLNHLELDWTGPVWTRLFADLSDGHKLVRYDERGNGLSDWSAGDLGFEAFVSDLEAVVDHLGIDRFPLLGISQGCAVSIEFAVRHPERVSCLLLLGGYAAGWRHLADEAVAEQREAVLTLAEHGWGSKNPIYRQIFSQTFMPSATHDEIDWFNEFQRDTASPANAVRFMEAFSRIDVRARLPEVRAPTLVLHARHDQRVPVAQGVELAATIPGARLVTLETDNHILLNREPATQQATRAMIAFLREHEEASVGVR